MQIQQPPKRVRLTISVTPAIKARIRSIAKENGIAVGRVVEVLLVAGVDSIFKTLKSRPLKPKLALLKALRHE